MLCPKAGFLVNVVTNVSEILNEVFVLLEQNLEVLVSLQLSVVSVEGPYQSVNKFQTLNYKSCIFNICADLSEMQFTVSNVFIFLYLFPIVTVQYRNQLAVP